MQSPKNQTRHWFSASRKRSDGPRNSLTAASSPCKELKFPKFSSADDDTWSFWPPKPYRCSFCRREFRSAQALGGHMNVHRVERAKLKLASCSNILSPSESLEHCSPNPNCSSCYSQSSEENCSENFSVEGSKDLKLGREIWVVEEMDCVKRKELFVACGEVGNKKQRKSTADLMLASSFTGHINGGLEICKTFGPVEVEEMDLELRLGALQY